MAEKNLWLSEDDLRCYFELLATRDCEHNWAGSEEILRGHFGLDEASIASMHEFLASLGGYCDCEILFNAMFQLLPELSVRV